MPVPADFVELYRFNCPFCKKLVRTGTVQDRPYGTHANPACLPFLQCDSLEQFGMIVQLRHKANDGKQIVN